MLEPGERSDLVESLRPPPGMHLDAAVGTTYTLDLDALAGLSGVYTTNNVAAACEHALSVLHALGTGHALDDDLGVGV